MSWLNPLSWGRKARVMTMAQSEAQAAFRKVMARYDAAQTDSDNIRHWSMSDGMSANAANSFAVRQTLRNRARYEMANNTYCKGLIQTVTNNIVGKGPRLQIRTGNKEADKKLTKAWKKWARAVKFAPKLRTMVKGWFCDGEAFANITTNRNLKTPVKLDFKPFEPEICTSVSRMLPVGQAWIDGIDFDDEGDPFQYWELPYHPGDLLQYGGNWQPKPVPASSVIHLFKVERAGQKRGVPLITPALPLFAQLRRYTLAVLAAAEIAAIICVYLETSGQVAASEVTGWMPFDLESRAGMVAPQGWKVNAFKPEQPVTTYPEFKREILSEIGRCLDQPYNIVACDSSSYNYSSGKLDHKTGGVSCEIDRTDVETDVCDRLYDAWIDEAALIPGLIPEGLPPIDDWEHVWFWDEAPSADPAKDAKAQDIKLRNATAFLSDEWESQGRDFEEETEMEAGKLGIDVKELRELIVKSIYSGAAVKDEPDDTEPDESAPQSKAKPASRVKGRFHATAS